MLTPIILNNIYPVMASLSIIFGSLNLLLPPPMSYFIDIYVV